MSDEERDARVRESLAEVALPPSGVTIDDFLRRYTHQLSGGQQQRVAIAMAFANRPHVIVCDEPTTGLDVTTQARVLKTVRELCQEHGVAALYVSHDLAVVAELADHVAVMYAGRIVERGPRDAIFSDARHPYTRRLLRAVPDLEGKRAVLGIPGRAPLPGNRPGGCFFAPRCDLAIDQCSRRSRPRAYGERQAPGRCYRADDAPSAIRVADEPAADGARPATSCWPLPRRRQLRLETRSCTTSTSRSAATSAWRSSASPARARRRRARCVAGLHHQYTGEVKLDDVKLATAARAARGGPQANPVRVPEPVRVAEPPPDDRADPGASAAAVPARGRDLARDDRLQGGRVPRAGRAVGRRPTASPTSCRGRAPARRDRPRARGRPRCWSATRSPRRWTSRSRPRS